MKPRRLFATLGFSAVAVCCLAIVESVGAQSATSAPEVGVVLTKLSPPVYPPLARQARIAGDVVVQVSVRKDGSVESIELFSGHPMLARAALDSAKQSTFVCRGCESTTSYLLTYTFGISSDYARFGPNCEPLESHPPQVTQSEDKINLTAEPTVTCDPSTTIVNVRARAAKCLYMWKCGFSEAKDK
jgi:TonB family protein